MMMGGLLLCLLLPLILVGLVIAAALGLLGQMPDLLERYHLLPDNSPVQKDDPWVRHCTQCGQRLQRGWAHCPGCGVEVHWV